MKTAFLLPLLVKFAAAKTISYKGIQEEDQVVTTTDNYSWGLDRLNQRKLPLDHVYHRAKFSGKGIDVYVIDTGINPNEYYNFTCHNFYPGKDDCTTTHYHGTHVGSLIGSKIFGVAPGVNIINLRVLGDNGSGMVSTVVEAIDFILRTKVTCAIINMSIGAGKSEILNMKTNELAAAGNAVVVAAGNSYGDACNYSPSSASVRSQLGQLTIMMHLQALQTRVRVLMYMRQVLKLLEQPVVLKQCIYLVRL